MTDTRQKVLSIFEMHRENPGASFEETHFLDFLLANPRRIGSIKNSFKGLRRYNAFIDQLQLEFGIFFSVKDRDTNYSLQRFVERVDELRSKPNSSLASLRGPMKGKIEGIVVFAPLIFWLPAIAFRKHLVIAAVLFACGAAILGVFMLIYRRERLYLRRLHDKIKASSLE